MQAQLLQDGTIYENGSFSVRYYTEEQFAKYKASANIVGSVYLIPENVENEQEKLLVQTPTNEVFQLRVHQVNPKEKAFGYIYLGQLDFIKIVGGSPKNIKPSEQPKQKKIKPAKQGNSKLLVAIVIVVAIIAIIGIGLLLFLPKGETTPNNPEPSATPEVSVPAVSTATTDIPLYVSFNLSKDESKINLSNSEKNTVDFIYEIYNGDKKLFATDKIAPGSQNTIDMTNYLQSGEYDLIFKVRCFLGDTEVNGTEEPVKVVMQ